VIDEDETFTLQRQSIATLARIVNGHQVFSKLAGSVTQGSIGTRRSGNRFDTGIDRVGQTRLR
jgi:hypothetical protein